MISYEDNQCWHCIQLIYIQHLDLHVNSMDIYKKHDVHLLCTKHLHHNCRVRRMDFYILN